MKLFLGFYTLKAVIKCSGVEMKVVHINSKPCCEFSMEARCNGKANSHVGRIDSRDGIFVGKLPIKDGATDRFPLFSKRVDIFFFTAGWDV